MRIRTKTIIDVVNDLYERINELLEDSFVLDELGRVINRKMQAKQDSITLQELDLIIRNLSKRKPPEIKLQQIKLQPNFPIMKLKDWEQLMLRAALEQTRGNQLAAARLLGVSPRQMSYKVKHKFKMVEYTRGGSVGVME